MKQNRIDFVRGTEENLFNLVGLDPQEVIKTTQGRYGGRTTEALRTGLLSALTRRIEEGALDGKNFYDRYVRGLAKLPELTFNVGKDLPSSDPFGVTPAQKAPTIKIDQRKFLEDLSLPGIVSARYDLENLKQVTEQARQESVATAKDTQAKQARTEAFDKEVAQMKTQSARDVRRASVLEAARRARSRIAQQNVSALSQARGGSLNFTTGRRPTGFQGRGGFASVSDAVLG